VLQRNAAAFDHIVAQAGISVAAHKPSAVPPAALLCPSSCVACYACSRDRSHFRRTNPCLSWRSVLLNYRVYVLSLAYALCFGVELTMNNVIALYLFNHFGLSLTASGFLGAWLLVWSPWLCKAVLLY
jgi:nitrate/nitrite transporter NarK